MNWTAEQKVKRQAPPVRVRRRGGRAVRRLWRRDGGHSDHDQRCNSGDHEEINVSIIEKAASRIDHKQGRAASAAPAVAAPTPPHLRRSRRHAAAPASAGTPRRAIGRRAAAPAPARRRRPPRRASRAPAPARSTSTWRACSDIGHGHRRRRAHHRWSRTSASSSARCSSAPSPKRAPGDTPGQPDHDHQLAAGRRQDLSARSTWR